MALRVAYGVQQAQIGGRVGAAINTANQMVEMPSGLRGDFLCADRTPPALSLPDIQQFLASCEMVCHFHGVAFLEVFLIGWIEWGGRALNLDVTFKWNVLRNFQDQLLLRFILLYGLATVHTLTSPDVVKVFGEYPVAIFVSVSSSCPVPQGAPDVVVDFREGCLGHHAAVIVSPSGDFRIEFLYDRFLPGGSQFADGLAHSLYERFDVLPGRLDQQLFVGPAAPVFAHVLPQECWRRRALDQVPTLH